MIVMPRRKIETASNGFFCVALCILGIAANIGWVPGVGLSADSSEAPDSGVNTSAGWKITRLIDWDRKEFHIEQWTSNDGLPMSFIQSLAQTRDGHIWAGTEFGLARFSGRRENDWEVFDQRNTPSFRDSNCISMAVDTQGLLWIGSPSALYRVSERSFLEFPLDRGFKANQVDRLAPLESGGLLIVRKERIQFFDDGNLETLFDESQIAANVGEVSNLQLIDGTEAWVCGARGLFRVELEKKEWREVESNQSRSSDWDQKHMLSFAADADESGRFWIAHNNGFGDGWPGEYRTLKLFESDLDTGDPWFSKIHLTSGNRVWYFNSFGGLYRVSEGNRAKAESVAFFEPYKVRDLLEDHEGNIWVGTEDAGLIRLRPHVFRTLTREDGLIDNGALSVSEDSKGRVWLGGQRTFASIDKDEMTVYFRKRDYMRNDSRVVYSDRQGRIWLAGQENLRFLMGDVVYWYADEDYKFPHLKSVTVLSILQTDDSQLWVGTNGGLFLMPDGNVEILNHGDPSGIPGRFASKDWHPVNSGLPETPFAVQSLDQDSTGQLWVGTESNGLFVKKSNESEFTQPKFLKSHDGLTAFCFLEDLATDVLWIGTDRGILRVKGEETFLIRGEHGLSAQHIFQILEDNQGWFWISHPRGIYRVRRSDLDDVASGRRPRVRSVEYGEADGIEVSDMQGGHQPAGCQTGDGRLWFPSRQGMVVIEPELVPVPEDEPRVIIQEVDVDGDVFFHRYLQPKTADSKSEPEEDPIVFEPGEGRNVKIRFSANAFHRASSMRYWYKMEGVDAEWKETGDDGAAVYTTLLPGNYMFRVGAVNGYGVPSSQDAALSFFVKQRFHQTRAFYGGLTFLFVILVWRIHRLRVSHREEIVRLEGCAMMERERARIAQDMHDDIGASLTNIALLSDVVRNDVEDVNAVKTRLMGISSKARGLVDELSELVWVNNPRYDTLPDLISYLRGYAAELFSMGPIRCELKFPESVPPVRVSGAFRRNLFLICKESLHNIMKHSNAAAAEILLELDSNSLRLTIADDGQGFSGLVERSSDGLHNMKKRIADLRGSIHLESHPGQGTRIRVRVPIPENSQIEARAESHRIE